MKKFIFNLIVTLALVFAGFVIGFAGGNRYGEETTLNELKPTMAEMSNESSALKSHNEWTEEALADRSRQYDELKRTYDRIHNEAKVEAETNETRFEAIHHHTAWLDNTLSKYVNAYGDEILNEAIDKYEDIEVINW